MRCLGLMSGTSADGVDAVLVDFHGRCQRPRWRLIQHHHHPYPADLRDRLIAAGQGAAMAAAEWLALGEATTEAQATAALGCDPQGSAVLVGCHGQTVWHRPPDGEQRGASWQLLHGPLLAERLKRPVVHDFRAADLALGGQGAPLVPAADAALLGRTGGWRALLNLGGIANITLIPPAVGPDRHASVQGWDCGPANSLIDLAMTDLSHGQCSVDRDGAMAAAGRSDEALIRQWLQESYLLKDPPKSTGRELFGRGDLERRRAAMASHTAQDQIATLTGFTAALVAQDLDRLQQRTGIRPLELIVAGGGRRNRTLMRELRCRCHGVALRDSDALKIPAEAREALVFALLAWWHHHRHPGNAPAITGASRPAVLGVTAQPS
ncbi:MAG: anhydro-N-acetylmuramic acid kinase [Synechococcus sp.]